MKKALITGITGQDGSYLAELLLKKGYEVHGTVRRSSSFNTGRIEHLYTDPHYEGSRLFLHYADLTDTASITKLISKIVPDEIYNLAAQSHVRVSFDLPEYTGNVTAIGAQRILSAMVETGVKSRFYQASSSEMYGKVLETPQKETTPFYPRSPYGCAKVFGYWVTVNFRESYDLHASNGILFNHESPRRGETFVTRKITRALARILAGKQKELYLGNLDAKRDWGHARDYVEAMWLMLQADQPDDYVISTGETHSVREFLDLAFEMVGLDWQKFVKIDPKYYRPTEVDLLLGDYSKARAKLGWVPKTTFPELVREMVEADVKMEGLDLSKVIKVSSKSTSSPSKAAAIQVIHPGNRIAQNAKIFVAGHRGMVGAAIVDKLRAEGHTNLVVKERTELDLCNQAAVNEFFKASKIDYAFVAAGKVGGIHANQTYPADFIYENLSIATNVMHAAANQGVKKLLYLGSSCIYPKMSPQPIKEESLLSGPLEPTNEAYAIAKIAGLKLCEMYRKQYGKNFISAMPTNLFGFGDSFHPDNSHVIPGLLRRFHEAKLAQKSEVAIWGTGMARREFLFVDDLADALYLLMQTYEEGQTINVGSGTDGTILELAQLVKEVVGFKGKITFDSSKSDGTPRKFLDSTRIRNLGWVPKTDLRTGLQKTYAWALENSAFEAKSRVLRNSTKLKRAA